MQSLVSHLVSFIFSVGRYVYLGMVGIGGLFVMGGGYYPGTIPQVLGALSVLLASVNVSGGFVITKRMLDMFKRASHAFTSISFATHRTFCRCYRSSGICLALRYPCGPVHERLPIRRKPRNVRSRASRIPGEQCSLHQYVSPCQS